MAAQPMKVSILIGADASGAKAGAAEAEIAMDGVADAGERAATGLDQMSAAARRAGSGLGASSSDAAGYARTLDDLRAKFNPLYASIRQYKAVSAEIRQAHSLGAISSAEMTAALGRERQATLASIDAIKGRNTALRSMPKAANNNLAGFQTANIAAQFQDIGVSAAMGMSPLQIALQQGTQLSSVLVGIQNPVRALGAAFMQLVSPVSLVTMGAIALGVAVAQYFASAATETRRLDELLDRHSDNIRAVKDAYGVAAEGLKEYLAESRTALLANLSATEADARAAVLSAAEDAYGDITGRAATDFQGPMNTYRAFGVAAENLRKSIAEGRPDILAYRDALSQIYIDPAASESQRKLALELRQIDEEAVKLAQALPKMANAIATISGASQRGFLVSDEKQRQAAAEALTDAYRRQAAEIEAVYKAGVTMRGPMVTNAEQLLKLEQALTEEYRKQRTEITSRGFRITDEKSMIEREKALTDTYLRRQAALDALKEGEAAYEAQRLAAAARSPQEKAAAARAVASAQVIAGEDPDVRAQRIALAGKLALENAERDLLRAQDDRARSLQSSVAAQEFELGIIGKSVAEQQRLRMEFQLTQQAQEQAARAGGQVSAQELELIRQKSAEYARLSSAIAGQNAIRSQHDDIDKLRLEISLVGQSAEVRARSLAAYEAEKQIRDAGIQSISREADAIRANAQTRAELQLQLERQQAAYQSVQQAGSTMIDQLVVGTGTLKDRLRAMADTLLQTFQQLAIANPLKNMLMGTNLPTLGDLFSGKTASPTTAATTTAAMTVTAGTVMINGVPLPGLSANPLTAANNNNPLAANQNFVRPELTPSGIVNNPVTAAATQVPGSNVESQVWNYWAAKGLPPHQIAGIMGNMKAESAFNPSAIGDGGNAWGLAQWNDRRFAMQNYVGPDWRNNVQGQLDFMNHEFQTSESAAWTRLRASTDVRSATAAVAGFERPSGYSLANPEGSHNWTGRLSGAEQAMQKFGQTTSTAANQVSTLSTGALDASKALTTGSNSITGSVNQLATTTAQIPAQSQGMFSTLFSSIGKGIQGIGSGFGSIFSSLLGGLFADGATFSGGNVIPFATGGVVTRPTLFPMAGGRMGVMGEAGAEAIMPLERGAGGRLGVRASYPRGMRERGEMRINFSNESTIVVTGTGDRELEERLRSGYREELDIRDMRIRASVPNWIEEWRRNPYARTYG